jgi:hypothetical protein
VHSLEEIIYIRCLFIFMVYNNACTRLKLSFHRLRNMPQLRHLPSPTQPNSIFVTLYIFFHCSAVLLSLDLLIVHVSRSHSDTPHSVGLLWTSDRPVAEKSDNAQHTRNRHPWPRGIRTRNPSKRANVVPRLRPCGHQDRHSLHVGPCTNP